MRTGVFEASLFMDEALISGVMGSGFKVLNAERLEDRIVYTAECGLFDDLPEGETARYSITFRHSGGHVTVASVLREG